MNRPKVLIACLVAGCLIDNPDHDGPADTTVGSDGATETDSGGSGPTGVDCEPLEVGAGPSVSVGPDQGSTLQQVLDSASPGTTVLLEPGTYAPAASAEGAQLRITADGIVLRSATGDPGDVVLQTDGMADGISIAAANVTIAELTLVGHVNAIELQTSVGDVTGTSIYRVNVVDASRLGVDGAAGSAGTYADDGSIACSTFEITDAVRDGGTCGPGAVRLEGSRDFVIRDNTFRGYFCQQMGTPAVIAVINGARGTQITRNVFANQQKGVFLGSDGLANDRKWPDNPCGPADVYWGHIEGELSNNWFWVGEHVTRVDSMIGLRATCDAGVYHNTVVMLREGFNSIEHRWPQTTGRVINNLLSSGIASRDGSELAPTQNLENAALTQFVDALGGDLHLVPGAAAIDDGLVINDVAIDVDIDGDPRDQAPDVGADELR